MSDELQLLNRIAAALESNQSDYCDKHEAARIMGLHEKRLPELCRILMDELAFSLRKPRGAHFVYLKKDCHKVAGWIDEGKIVLPKFKQNKAA